jgi:hypothetical protein
VQRRLAHPDHSWLAVDGSKDVRASESWHCFCRQRINKKGTRPHFGRSPKNRRVAKCERAPFAGSITNRSLSADGLCVRLIGPCSRTGPSFTCQFTQTSTALKAFGPKKTELVPLGHPSRPIVRPGHPRKPLLKRAVANTGHAAADQASRELSLAGCRFVNRSICRYREKTWFGPFFEAKFRVCSIITAD